MNNHPKIMPNIFSSYFFPELKLRKWFSGNGQKCPGNVEKTQVPLE